MSEDNLKLWDKVAKPPKEALKEIKGGRLSGMTDIKPQWRYKAMTEQFGPCGVGWRYDITKQWTEPGSDEQIICYVNIELFFLHDGVWSEAIPGTGGSMIVTKERAGLHTSDEGYKMALTDALSVAMSRIGVAAEIYMGNWTGSKYKDQPEEKKVVNKKVTKKVEPITIDTMIVFINSCKTTKSLENYYTENKDTINGFFKKEKEEVMEAFAFQKQQITEGK